MQRGYGLYAVDARTAAWPGVRDAIYRCYEDTFAKAGIAFLEQTDPNGDVDLLYLMPDAWSSPGAVGLAYYANAPAHVDLNFRAGIVVWDSTVCHEAGHIDGQEDLYIHPLTCDPTRKWTRMSCGTFVGTLQPYDRDIVLNTYIPDLPSEGHVEQDATWLFVVFNSLRRSSVGCVPFSGAAFLGTASSERDNWCGHYSRYLDNATRVSIWTSDDNGLSWQYTGFNAAPAPRDGTGSRGFLKSAWCVPGRRWAAHPESALRATFPTTAGGVGFVSGDFAVLGTCA